MAEALQLEICLMKCDICGKDCLNISTLSQHAKKIHKIDSETTYLKFNDVKLCSCGNHAKFISASKGYRDFCSLECYYGSDKHKEQIRKLKESFDNRDLAEEDRERRITNVEKYGVEFVSLLDGFSARPSQICIERYGCVKNFSTKSHRDKAEQVLQNNKDEINEKRREFWRSGRNSIIALEKRIATCEIKYGTTNVSKNSEIRKKISDARSKFKLVKDTSKFKDYLKTVRELTKIHIEKLFSNWNGLDYYTNEQLITNDQFSLVNPGTPLCKNKFQPTVDHKISCFYGFENGLDPNVIADFRNLCICGRSINSSKSYLTEDQFMEKLKS